MIFGGRSGEHEVSLASAASVLAAIDPARYDVVPMGITRDGQWLVGGDPLRALAEAAGVPLALPPGVPSANPGSGQALARVATAGGLPAGTAASLDVVFPLVHGPYGEDGTLQGLLELADVPYVGAGVLASAVGMDKAAMKAVFRAHGLPIVPYLVLRDHEWSGAPGAWRRRVADELGYPCFVKPANLGSSVGISKVTAERALEAAVATAFAHDRKILVERGVVGREIEVSVLGNDEPEASVPGEVLPGASGTTTRPSTPTGSRSSSSRPPCPRVLPRSSAAWRSRPSGRSTRRGSRAWTSSSTPTTASGERDQHDPGVHPLLGLPAALGGHRPPLPRARRPPDRARPRAPRPQAAACHPSAIGDRAGCQAGWRTLALPAVATGRASRGGP